MERKSSRYLPYLVDLSTLPSPQLSRTVIRLVYERNEHVRGCVDDLVRRVSTMPWNAEPPEIERFLERPCIEHSWRTFVSVIVTDLLLYNSVAIEIVYSLDRSKLLELVPISTANLERKLHPKLGTPVAWKWKPPDRLVEKEVEFSLDELYPIVLYPSIDRWKGVSPVEAIIDQVTVLIESWAGVASSELHGGLPAGVLLLAGVTQADIDRAKEELSSDDPLSILGAERGQWIEFKNRLKPDEFRELNNAAREIVYDAFGRAPGRVGSESSSRLAAVQARASDESMFIPLCYIVASSLSDMLRKWNAKIEIIPRELTDQWRESRTLRNLVESQILTLAEARRRLGLG